MKKILGLLVFLIIAKDGFSQWSTDGGNENILSGKIAVGNSDYFANCDIGSQGLTTWALQGGQVVGLLARHASNATIDNRIGSLFFLKQSTANTSTLGISAATAYMFGQNPSGTLSVMTGLSATTHLDGSGTVGWARSASAYHVISNNGTTNNWAGFYVKAPEHLGSPPYGNITNGYGLFIEPFPAFISNRIAISALDANATSEFGGTIQVRNGGLLRLENGAGLRIVTGATNNYILTSDASGNASWQAPPATGCTTCWSINGNTGTVDGTNFLGTIDDKPLNFRVNNFKAGRIDGTLQNTFFGKFSGLVNLAGNNAFYGQYSGYANTTGEQNTAIGAAVFTSNVSGSHNTAVGHAALKNNISGNYNTAIGQEADVNADAFENATAIGYAAHATASNTVQLGNDQVTKVYAGVGNTATTVTGNLQVTGGSPVAGQVLTAVDGTGLASWATATSDCLTCWSTFGNAGTVDGTHFVGTTDYVPLTFRVNNAPAGRIDVEFDLNTTLYGWASGRTLTTGMDNTGLGHMAISNITSGAANTAVGSMSLLNNSEGNDNAAVGTYSLINSTGSWNTAIGAFAGITNTTGTGNTALGFATLETNREGVDLTAVGRQADVSENGLKNATALGAGAIVNNNDKVWLGDANVFTVESAAGVYLTSDARFKTNVKEEVKGLEFIKRLRPVVYNFDTRKLTEFLTQNMPDSIRKIYLNKDFSKSTAVRQSGFIAQEVEKTAKEIGYDFNGIHIPNSKTDNYSLSYSQFVVPLTKAVQELSKQNDELRKEIDELKALVKGKTEGSIKLESGSDAQLFQNAPNPFNKSTVIKYSIPFTAKKAVLKITSISGVRIKEFDLSNKTQSVQINGGELSAGTYVYALIVDDVFIDSKQMILTR